MVSSKPPPPSSPGSPTPKQQQQQQKSLLNSSVKSLSFLVALQLFSRLGTSVLNQALVRLASPSAFGTAAIQFELVLSTILFLSREGVRNAILRSKVTTATSTTGKKREDPTEKEHEDDERVKQLNLTFIPALLGVPLAVVTTLVYLKCASEEVRRQPYLAAAVAVYAGAAVVELLSEPMHNRYVCWFDLTRMER
jgi:oligosaccharide translocation protein RFT1